MMSFVIPNQYALGRVVYQDYTKIEHAIETGLTIGRDECELRGAEVVPIPYLPGHAGRDDAGFGVEGDVVARDLFGSIVRGRYLVHVRFVPAVGGVIVVRHGGARSVRSGMVLWFVVCALRRG